MRKFVVLMVTGSLVAFLGMALVLAANQNVSSSGNFSIPAGSDWYYRYVFNLAAGATLSGSFSESAGRPLDLFVLDANGYASYAANLVATNPLASAHGVSGTFRATVSAAGTYYVVLDHGDGMDYVVQAGQTTLSISRLDLLLFAVGIALAAVGVVVFVVGSRQRKEALSRVLATHPTTYVCPFCGTPTRLYQKVCGTCGRSFEMNPPAASPPRPPAPPPPL